MADPAESRIGVRGRNQPSRCAGHDSLDVGRGSERAACGCTGHGYPSHMLARLGGVSRDADNAIAAAFRTAETRVVKGGAEATGAIVVPLITPAGCAGVLAFELRHGREQSESVKAFAAIIAAQLATLTA